MLALVLLVVSIGLADSLNPSTVGPVLVLATQRQAAGRVAGFTAGVFGVSTLAGALLVLGPGQLLLDALPHVSPLVKHLAEVAGGILLLVLAAGLWRGRSRLAERLGKRPAAGGSAGALAAGAGIMAVELPTAAPYFAAIAAIVASGSHLAVQLALVALYNVAFVAPLLAILAVRVSGGERAMATFDSIGAWLRRFGVPLIAGLLAVAGVAAIAIGVVGLA